MNNDISPLQYPYMVFDSCKVVAAQLELFCLTFEIRVAFVADVEFEVSSAQNEQLMVNLTA